MTLRVTLYILVITCAVLKWAFLEFFGSPVLLSLLSPGSAMVERVSTGLVLILSGTGLGFLVPTSKLPNRFLTAPRLIGGLASAFAAVAICSTTSGEASFQAFLRIATAAVIGIVAATLFVMVRSTNEIVAEARLFNIDSDAHFLLTIISYSILCISLLLDAIAFIGRGI